jgi:CRISPR-associated protein Cmr5
MTLQQQRAALAFDQLGAVRGRPEEDRLHYAGMAQKLPVLIRSAGLCQALHFVRSRQDRPVLGLLLDHLAAQLRRTDPAIADGAALCERARRVDLAHYLWMTREALACAEWYARLSQSELGVERGAGER